MDGKMSSTSVRFTVAQKVFVVKMYFKYGEQYRRVHELLRRRFNIHLMESEVGVISAIIRAFELTGSVTDSKFRYTVAEKRPEISPSNIQTTLPDSFWAKGVNREVIIEEVEENDVKDEEQHEQEQQQLVDHELEMYNDDEVEMEVELVAEDEVIYELSDSPANVEVELEAPRTTLPRVKKEQIFQCKQCQQVFPDNKLLRDHRRTHETNKWICELCGKISHQKRIHKAHMLVHETDKPYVCSDCPMSFVRLQGLKRHRLTHTGEKPYNCEHCGAKFAAYMSHQMHVRLHTGERPHVCRHCGERFIGQPALNAHLKTHAGEYEHQCSMCTGRYKTEKTLQEHIQKKHVVVVEEDF